MGPRGHRARCRRSIGPGRWEVRARIERFVEPALLQLLSEQPMHGYELLERLPELAREERRVDLGNLYRLLRSLEEEGIVSSDWDESVSGPAKRIYRLTPAGEGLLDQWADALRDARAVVERVPHPSRRREGGEHMTHRSRHRGGPGCGLHGRRRRSFNREEWLAKLEEYQRDLEQETADVADLIKRLQDEAPAQTDQATQTTTV